MANPLFPNTNRRRQVDQAIRDLQSQLQNPLRNNQRTLATAQRLKALLRRNRELDRLFGDIVADIRQGITRETSGARKLLNKLGPVGRLINRAIGMRAEAKRALQRIGIATGIIEQIADAATKLTPEELGGRPTAPSERRKFDPPPRRTRSQPSRPDPPATPATPATPAETERPREADSPQAEIDPNAGLPPNTVYDGPRHVIVQTGSSRQRFRIDDPVITGRMMNVRSSNVHSIGYRFNFNQPQSSLLIVRYLQKDRRGLTASVPGPWYQYEDCSLAEFREMRRAASKGRWVWDNLRIRGSRTAHQKRYRLIGLGQGYVPRRAGIRAGREAYIPRKIQGRQVGTGRQVTLRSPLRLQIFGRTRPDIARRDVNRGRNRR